MIEDKSEEKMPDGHQGIKKGGVMRFGIAVLAILMTWAQVWAETQSEVVDDVTWYYSISAGKAKIASGSIKYAGNLTIPATLGECPVTSIGSSSFWGCTGLKSVTIPSNVTSIEDNAFRQCSGLVSLTISEGVVSIGYGAFYECRGLKSVTIPSSVASIGDLAFFDCTELSSAMIVEGVTSMGASAFSHCSKLASVAIPSSVRSIGGGAFSCCTSLTNMVLPFVGARRGNTGTEDSLFGYVFGSTSGGEGTTATQQAFSSKYYDNRPTYYIPTSLRNVEITDETVVGYGAFYGCSGLTSVTVSGGVTSIGNYAFYNCSGLMSVTIPSDVTSIGSYVFYNCSKLTSVTIPVCVSTIGSYAFYNCSSLAMEIPQEATSIGDYAFYGCNGLTSIAIPSGVESIGSHAFDNCGGLMSFSVAYLISYIVRWMDCFAQETGRS